MGERTSVGQQVGLRETAIRWIKINQNGWSIRNEFLLLQNLNLGKTCIFCVNKCDSDCFNHFFVPHLPGMGGVKASVENAWNSKSKHVWSWVHLGETINFFAEATRSCLPGVLLPQSVAQQEDRQNNVYSYSSRSIDFAGSQNLNDKKKQKQFLIVKSQLGSSSRVEHVHMLAVSCGRWCHL